MPKSAPTPTLWEKKESEHFVFYYFPNSYTQQIIDRLIEEREKAFNSLNANFKVTLPEKIRWYFFPSREQGLKLLSSLSPNQAIPAALTIFTVYGEKDGKVYDSTPGHELTHVLSFYWDNYLTLSYKFLSEGLARYLDQTKRDNHQLAKELKDNNQLIPFLKILSPQSFKSHDPAVTYIQSASFIGFLIEQFGWGKFKKLWLIKDYLEGEIEKIYGHSLPNLESQWMEFLDGLTA